MDGVQAIGWGIVTLAVFVVLASGAAVGVLAIIGLWTVVKHIWNGWNGTVE